jgi:RNA polymerase sigma factor (sigma-70 family)
MPSHPTPDTTVEHDERSDSEALAADATRARRSDRDLALELDRPAPTDAAVGAGSLEALSRRAAARGEPPREAVAAAKAGDERAVTEVVEGCLPQIARLARRYAAAPHVERLELIQEGVAGLLEALHRYDPERGTPLCAYAQPTVQRAMQRLVGELGDAVALSDHALRRLSRLKSAEDELMREYHRLPTRLEIIERSGVSEEEAERLLRATSRPRSLEEPITAEDGGVIGSLGDLVHDPRAEDAYDRILDVLEGHELRQLLSVLSPRERSILRARYGLDGDPQSVRQVAERLGLSTSRVRDIERRALRKLRQAAAVAAGAAR